MKQNEKQIKIPMSLFFKLVCYFLFDETENHKEIKKALEEKTDALIKHELYTQYKTADTEEAKQKARIEYLDKVGMRDSFRW